jgi:hypothetical protein
MAAIARPQAATTASIHLPGLAGHTCLPVIVLTPNIGGSRRRSDWHVRISYGPMMAPLCQRRGDMALATDGTVV